MLGHKRNFKIINKTVGAEVFEGCIGSTARW